ncbi:tagatose-bisphosphate aldolase [Lactobacillus plantarum subsp. plantarum] [Lactiplantibacillus mudanjiangensis]|uniref:hypothetical protein n=1 Tax=Lactiplantibacillus mudanjiangensis TaxID=1296538 RepID=UPI001014FEEF|nr:tagatose-bisphosphate aldolase [Lactobacillus plantarum subsp. plantarum] [Lactiplantibacillus mudanjiangensis]
MNRIEMALQQRKQNILTANENELLTSIAYATAVRVVKADGTKEYSKHFLDELENNGIEVFFPGSIEDDKWHFQLPSLDHKSKG